MIKDPIKISTAMPFLLGIIFFVSVLIIPICVFCSGYQEEKLFDSDFYSKEELRQKIETHTSEIKTLDASIRALNMDVDWLVLKVNQIEDSGRIAPASLKKSIASKEKTIANLTRSKNRLSYLVEYYFAMAGSQQEKDIKDLALEKIKTIEKNKPAPPVAAASDTALQLKDTAGKYGALGLSQKELETAIQKAGLGDWIDVVGTGSCLKLETTLPILFPTGSARIASEYKTFFKKLADFLSPYDVKVLVNGYADEVPIKNKKYPSNFELGATRAANIVHQLVGYGLRPSIFRIGSTGKYRFASKQMMSQKTLERRAEVTVIFSG